MSTEIHNRRSRTAAQIGIAILAMIVAGSASAQSTLLDRLQGQGIAITSTKSVSLPPPLSLRDDTPSTRKAIAGRFDWNRFTKPTVVAPIWMDLDSITDERGVKIGHQIHFRFVTHRSLADLRDRDLMTGIFGGSEADNDRGGSEFRDLTAEKLTKDSTPGFTPIQARNYAFLKTPLMNRVLLQGVVEGQSHDVADMHVLAWRLVDQIQPMSELAATWRPIAKDDLGKSVIGPSKPYRGCGGYIALQGLQNVDADLADACLVEARLVIHEPTDWFGGSNFLRSKFPLLIQEAARKFRREVQTK